MKNIKDLIYLNKHGWYWPKIDPSDIADSTWSFLHDKYPDTPEKIANYVPLKRVAVQAGGNCGLYVKKLSDLFETVYTFEPDPLNFACLNLNVIKDNVYKFPTGLGNEHVAIAMADYNAQLGCGGNHISNSKKSGTIPTLKIDDLNLQVCDLIMLDVEGYELFALQGGKKTIQRCKPVITLELANYTGRYGYSLEDLFNFLSSINYKHMGAIADTMSDHLFMHIGV